MGCGNDHKLADITDEDMNKLFAKFAGKDAGLDKDEMQKMLKANGFDIPERVFMILFVLADKSGDGKI